LLIGTKWPTFAPPAARPPLQLRWRPFLGIEGGDTIKRGASKEKDEVFRVEPRLRVEIYLNVVRSLLRLSDVSVFADNKTFVLPLVRASQRTQNFFVGGIEVLFTENVGVQFLYKLGEDAPKFEHV